MEQGIDTDSQTTGELTTEEVGLGGLGVTCSPRDPRFPGSNPAEVDGFFQNVKLLSTSNNNVMNRKEIMCNEIMKESNYMEFKIEKRRR